MIKVPQTASIAACAGSSWLACDRRYSNALLEFSRSFDSKKYEIAEKGRHTVLHALPTPADFIRLRTICGLRPPPPAQVAPALAASLHSIIAQTQSGETIGTVRAIGDGHLYVQICDMAVHPSYQRQGVGKRMLDEMIRCIDENCGDVYLSLIAMPGSVEMYRRVGFVETGGRGMKRTKWPKTG